MHEKDERGRQIPSTRNNDFWVCAGCMLPSRMVFDALTNRHMPARATHILSAHGDLNGRWRLRWATDQSGEVIETMTFSPYPRKPDMPKADQGRDILVEMWKKLDYSIDIIRDVNTIPDIREIEKGKAGGIAECIAVVMAPFYPDQTAVLKESMARWKARQEGVEHESPGLAEKIWDPSTRFDGTVYEESAEPRRRTKPPVKFDDQKITFIKHTLENGTMTPEVLAGMFDCTVDDIKAVMG